MTLIRPHPVEYEITRLNSLQAGYPRYYEFVVLITRNIFYMLGFDGGDDNFPNKVAELDALIREQIEIPFEAPYVCIVSAFDDTRTYGKKNAYCIIGEGVDAIEITKFQMQMRLDHIKQWCYSEVMQLTPYIRFTLRQPI